MAVEMKVPTVGESISEVTIAHWLKEDGAYVELDETICEIESDKATFELNAEASGILHIKAQAGETVEIGAIVASIDTEGQPSGEGGGGGEKEAADKAPAKTEAESEAPAPQATQEGGYAKGHPSPAAGKILNEKGISPESVQGSGPGGRITKEDANKAEAKAAPAQPAKEAPKEAAPKPQSDQAPRPASYETGSRGTSRERMSALRKTIARRLVEVKNQTAMLTTFNEADMSKIMSLRKDYKDTFKQKHEVGLGFMSFFVKACALALEQFPAVNGSIDGEEIVYHNYVDMGIAVSTERGLVVPVIRDAHRMSMAEIEKEIIRLAARARDGKLGLDEMTGGTFTITNGGIFGSMLSTPIINAPQSAILGMHNIVERPVAINGQVEIRPIMYLALSYDHRIIDGKESVSFLVRVKELLEEPTRMLLEV